MPQTSKVLPCSETNHLGPRKQGMSQDAINNTAFIWSIAELRPLLIPPKAVGN